MLPALRRVAPRLTRTANVGVRGLSKGTQATNPKLGIIRLDYDYVAAPGDIDHPGSFGYEVVYRVVPGLSFEMAQEGTMSPDVKTRFIEAIKYLEAEGVNGYTGDCGFMMNFQQLARTNTKLPVYMSSLCQLPSVTCAYGQNEKIAIFTANGVSLAPMRDLIRDECGVDTEQERYIIVGCEDIPHFGEEVAAGDKVDTDLATPGMVEKALEVQKANPDIRAFLFECTELPQFSDAVRAATGLPVYDSITMSDSFMSGVTDNKRFGLNDWQGEFDGKQADYKFGDNLTDEQKENIEYKDMGVQTATLSGDTYAQCHGTYVKSTDEVNGKPIWDRKSGGRFIYWFHDKWCVTGSQWREAIHNGTITTGGGFIRSADSGGEHWWKADWSNNGGAKASA